MNVYTKDNHDRIQGCVACIGYFDGVHLGHQALIRRTIEIARNHNLTPIVITFYPDPLKVIQAKNVYQITTLKQRLELIENYGINDCLLLEFDYELKEMQPSEFIDKYILGSNVRKVVCGADFRFGKDGVGKPSYLEKYIPVEVVPDVIYQSIKISSSYIRELILSNDLDKARQLLGHE